MKLHGTKKTILIRLASLAALLQMSDPDKILRVVNEHTLAQMKGVPAVLSKTLCEPPLSDSITYRDEITVLKVEEAKEVCEWARGEVSDVRKIKRSVP